MHLDHHCHNTGNLAKMLIVKNNSFTSRLICGKPLSTGGHVLRNPSIHNPIMPKLHLPIRHIKHITRITFYYISLSQGNTLLIFLLLIFDLGIVNLSVPLFLAIITSLILVLGVQMDNFQTWVSLLWYSPLHKQPNILMMTLNHGRVIVNIRLDY